MNYDDYSNQSASEKIGLCIIEASKRLMGWVIYAGSVYKIENQDFIKIVSIVDSGTAYVEVASIGAITAGKWYYDRASGVLYLQASDSSNPNSRFLVSTFRLYFANVPVIAPHDLSTGFDIEWLPMLVGSNQMGVEIDKSPDQFGIAIEGSGTVNLVNDKQYWAPKYEKYSFDNNGLYLYSWNRQLPITESKLIFSGKIQEKQYSLDQISFTAKDAINELRKPITLPELGDIISAKLPLNLTGVKQRRIYGLVNGFRPQNIDHLTNPITVTDITVQSVTDVSIHFTLPSLIIDPPGLLDSPALYFKVGDTFTFNGIQEVFEVKSLYNGAPGYNNVELTKTYSLAFMALLVGKSPTITRNNQGSFENRNWKIAEHALREQTATIISQVGERAFKLSSITDLEVGSECSFSGTVNALSIEAPCVIESIILPDIVRVVENTDSMSFYSEAGIPSSFNGFTYSPSIGDGFKRLSVSNVRINDKKLIYKRDYTYSASDGTMRLRRRAEGNIAPLKRFGAIADEPITYNNPGVNASIIRGATTFDFSRTPIGTLIWDMYSDILNPQFIEVIDKWEGTSSASDSTMSVGDLYYDPMFVGFYTFGDVPYKIPSYYQEGQDVLTCTVMGATENGLTSGTWIKTAPIAVKHILESEGLSAQINAASFTAASLELADHTIGIAFPESYTDRTAPTIREAINKINRSVFGVLIQNEDFELEFKIINPSRTNDVLKFLEDDTINFQIDNISSDVFSDVRLTYDQREFDYQTKDSNSSLKTSSSDHARYLVKKETTFEIDTYLVTEYSAKCFSSRWAFFLRSARNILSMRTKLRGSQSTLMDKTSFEHRFNYDGPFGSVRLFELNSSKKSYLDSELVMDDISSALSRTAIITEAGMVDFSQATTNQKMFNGFITDSYGLQSNDPDTMDTNLIW